MDIGQALFRHIAGSSPRRAVNDFSTAISFVAGQHKSKAAAARALGVAPSTFRRWLGGAKPKPERAAGIISAAKGMQRRARLSPGREKRLRRGGGNITVLAKYDYDQTEQFREIAMYRYLDADVGDHLVDAYLEGAGPDTLAEIFHESISDAPFYENTFDPNRGEDVDGWDVREVSW